MRGPSEKIIWDSKKKTSRNCRLCVAVLIMKILCLEAERRVWMEVVESDGMEGAD